MGFDRRTFLQQAGLALLTLGLSETNVSLNRYVQTLAQPTNRKLALLVGINDYSSGTKNLKGSLNDVELQKELLIYRFGFHPQDILTLTGDQATRENIKTAFVEHLIQQAMATDVVIFHFSGYGSFLSVPQPDTISKLVKGFVPVDGINSTTDSLTGNILSEETLVLLMRSLATDQVTMILDTSYTTKGSLFEGNLRSRTFPNKTYSIVNEEEFVMDLSMIKGLRLDKTKALNFAAGVKGIVLCAAKENQIAVEGIWSDFQAGLFTYSLTQYLWEITPASTIITGMMKTAEKVQQVRGLEQQPQLVSTNKQPLLSYYLIPNPFIGANLVKGLDNNGLVELKLLGVPNTVIENYGINSCFSLPEKGRDIYLQIRSRLGLIAKAKLINKSADNYSLNPGQLAQEMIRVLPHKLGLVVALEGNLTRIERVDATSAFSTIHFVSSVINAYEGNADCLFGRLLPAIIENQEKSTSSEGYGLFSPGGLAIANTAGKTNEAVKSAVKRLEPQLKTLLAAKLWRLTVNEYSSDLKVKAFLDVINPKNQIVIQTYSLSTITNDKFDPALLYKSSLRNYSGSLPNIAVGNQIQYRLENLGDSPVYFMLFGIDADNKAIAVDISDSNNWSIAPKQSKVIPDVESSFKWIVNGSLGLTEVMIIYSKAPLTKTLQALLMSKNFQGDQEKMVNLLNPLEVAFALLEDLNDSSAVPVEITGNTGESYALDVNTWVTLSFLYEVS